VGSGLDRSPGKARFALIFRVVNLVPRARLRYHGDVLKHFSQRSLLSLVAPASRVRATPKIRRRAAGSIFTIAFAVMLAACSDVTSVLWPPLGGDQKAKAARAAATGSPSPSGVPAPSRPSAGAPPAERLAFAQDQSARLAASLPVRGDGFGSAERDAAAATRGYGGAIGEIVMRLDAGVPPGDPEMQGKWSRASGDLDRIGSVLGRLNDSAGELARDNSAASRTLDDLRSLGPAGGITPDERRQIEATEAELQRGASAIDRLGRGHEIAIRHASGLVACERERLQALAGDIRGGGSPGRAAIARAVSVANASAAAGAASGRRPFVVIRFDRPNPGYEDGLYEAVSSALDRRPESRFDLVAVPAVAAGNDQQTLAQQAARCHAEAVRRMLMVMGLPADRIAVSGLDPTSAAIAEVRIFIR
jgi:hypothetical protein